ncbi:hypothetical protein ACWDOP_13320 [Nocardia sp. NPDC003693]
MTELPLDRLIESDRPDVRAALVTALSRRSALGITLAGHSPPLPGRATGDRVRSV